MRTLALLFVLCPMMSYGLDRLSALSMIESGDNDRMVGRAGEVSRYQILKREWRTVTNSTRFTDRKVAEAVTLKLIDKRVASFKAIYKRNPTDFEFYGLWNAPSQVYRGRVSPVVAERCRRFANLCQLADDSTPTMASASTRTAGGGARPAAMSASASTPARPTPAPAPTVFLAQTVLRSAGMLGELGNAPQTR
jgi:hypothetical protein